MAAHLTAPFSGPKGSHAAPAGGASRKLLMYSSYGDIVQSVSGREGVCYSLQMLVMNSILLLLQFFCLFVCLIGFCFITLFFSFRHILAFLIIMENSYVITFTVPIMYSFTVRRRAYFLFFIDSNNVLLQQ